MSHTQDRVGPRFQIPIRELKIKRWCEVEYFWHTSRCLEMQKNTVLSVWYIFSVETIKEYRKKSVLFKIRYLKHRYDYDFLCLNLMNHIITSLRILCTKGYWICCKNIPIRIVKCNCIHNILVSFQYVKLFSWGCIPHFTCSVIASCYETWQSCEYHEVK